jgi:hypothetical protein
LNFFLLALAGVWFGPDARAERSTELVVVGAHVQDDSGLDLLDSVHRLPGVKPVGPEAVRARIGGRGSRIVDDALLADGRRLLAEGRVLFEHADLETAKDRITAAVTALEKGMSGSTDGRPLVEALLVQGNLGLAMGEREAGRSAFRQVLLMDPERELDPVHYPPKVLALFQEVRSEVLKVPFGSLSVEVDDARASIHVDGRHMGEGSMVVKSLPAGRHHVLVSGSSGRRTYASVEIQSGRKLSFRPELSDYYIGQPARSEAEREIQTASLYRSLGDQTTEGLVLIAGETGVDEVAVQLYETRTGNFSTVLRSEASGDASGAIVAILPGVIDFLTPSGGLKPGSVSTEGLGLNLSTNPIVSRVLFQTESSVMAVDGGTLATGISEVQPATSNPGSAKPIPWGVWAGAVGMIATATAVSLLLRPERDDQQGERSTGTGTVVIAF